MALHDDIEFMRQGLNVRRYHQHVTLEIDTVGKHSCGVALFVNLINPDARKEVIVAAISHDLGEWTLGDIPAPTKRALPDAARALLDTIEDDALAAHGFSNGLTPIEYKLLKVADYCDGLSFAIEERRRGNSGLRAVAKAYVSYLTEIIGTVAPEVQWRSKALQVITILNRQRGTVYDSGK